MAKKYVSLTFPENLIREPVIYRLGQDFNIVPTIFKAKVSHTEGWVVLELDGEKKEIEKVIGYLKGKGVIIEEGGKEILKRETGKKISTVRIHLTFPDIETRKPVIYEIGKKYNIITNIRRADMTERAGWMDLEISGDDADIDRAIDYLKAKNIKVNPIEGDVVE
jgi:ABC-type methionine transport system ATPase subunit